MSWKKYIRTITINPTSNCNLSCSFCWGPNHLTQSTLSTNDWKKIIYFFYKKGVNSIVFNGGEPLVRKDITRLIKYAKKLDLRITLSTNAILLPRYASEILPLIDDIGIPLDGSTPEKNYKMRLGNPRAFDATINALYLINSINPKIEVTIRTVASKVNYSDVVNIGNLLTNYYGLFDRWKIYQFIPVGYGKINESIHKISSEDFQSLINKLINTFPHFNIFPFYPHQRIGRYLFIGSDGTVYNINDDGEYTNLGSFFSMSESEINKVINKLSTEMAIRRARRFSQKTQIASLI